MFTANAFTVKKTVCSIAAGLGLAMASVSSAQADPLKIGMSFQELNNEYFVVMQEALREAADSIGAEVIVTDAHHDVSKQISDVEDMVQRGVDILLLNPTDSVGIESAVISAHDAGVVTVAVDAQANGPLDSFVGSKNYDAGYMACKYLGEKLGGKGNIAILDGIPVVPILERVRGCEAAVKEFKGLHIVAKQNGKQERDRSLTVTENMLQANPNLKGLFSVNDTGALGALTAIEGSGMNVKLVSVDGNPEAVKAIADGNQYFIATSAQYPRDQVRLGLGIALSKRWGAHVPKVVPVDVDLIDHSNAASFHW